MGLRDTILALCYIGGGAGWQGSLTPSPPQTNICFLVSKNTFTDVFDITCDIGNFRAHNFRPQTTRKFTYLRSIMKQARQRLNICQLMMRCHKWITDINTVKTATRFACANEQLKAFWKI